MNYARQCRKPDWYDADDTKLYYDATFGSSFLNEWYEFDDREDALKYISTHFEHQTFIDEFTFANDGELYSQDDVVYIDEGWGGADPHPNAKPADIADAVWAESSF